MDHIKILLVGGKPYAGKSTIIRQFIANNPLLSATHFSIGERIRAINKGKMSSTYKKDIAEGVKTLSKYNVALPHYIMDGVFEEFFIENNAQLIIIDNYPVYQENIDGFKKTIQKANSQVIAFCHVEVADEVVFQRINQREQRWSELSEDEAFVKRRLIDYQKNVEPTLSQLSRLYPLYNLDGKQPAEINVACLQEIYTTTTVKN